MPHTEHDVTFKEDNDVIRLTIPDGRVVDIHWSDIDDDALPELLITLPAPMVANCRLADMAPGKPLDGVPSAVLSLEIDIPIERIVAHGPSDAPVDDSGVDLPYLDALQELARKEYGSDEIEIDDEADISEGDDGTWVQAWVFLSNDTLRENGLGEPDEDTDEAEDEEEDEDE